MGADTESGVGRYGYWIDVYIVLLTGYCTGLCSKSMEYNLMRDVKRIKYRLCVCICELIKRTRTGDYM